MADSEDKSQAQKWLDQLNESLRKQAEDKENDGQK
jgi:hypothetical protein